MAIIDLLPATPTRADDPYRFEPRTLRRAPLFAALEGEAFEELVRASERRTVERRRTLGIGGDGYLYVVGRGRARVTCPAGERELTLSYLGAGDVHGEAEIFEPRGIERSAVALEPLEAVRVPNKVVKSILEREPKFAQAMTHLIAERRAIAEHRLHAVLSRTVESRVAEFLLMVARQHGVPEPRGTLIGVKFTHLEIAYWVGSTRETVTRVLAEFKRAGLIEIDARRVVILDADGMHRRI